MKAITVAGHLDAQAFNAAEARYPRSRNDSAVANYRGANGEQCPEGDDDAKQTWLVREFIAREQAGDEWACDVLNLEYHRLCVKFLQQERAATVQELATLRSAIDEGHAINARLAPEAASDALEAFVAKHVAEQIAALRRRVEASDARIDAIQQDRSAIDALSNELSTLDASIAYVEKRYAH